MVMASAERERAAVELTPSGQPRPPFTFAPSTTSLSRSTTFAKRRCFIRSSSGCGSWAVYGAVRTAHWFRYLPITLGSRLQTGELADTTFLSNGPLTSPSRASDSG
jgi:hypothetical protein